MKWTYFPKNMRIADHLLEIVKVFEKNESRIDSRVYKHNSNKVLGILCDDLIEIGYKVELSKSKADKIRVPVLFGENGKTVLGFEADGYSETLRTVIEIEAGRAVSNYQFLKDLFQACLMNNVDYLCIGVRGIYRDSEDYKKVCDFISAVYLSEKMKLPLLGVLIIGY